MNEADFAAELQLAAGEKDIRQSKAAAIAEMILECEDNPEFRGLFVGSSKKRLLLITGVTIYEIEVKLAGVDITWAVLHDDLVALRPLRLFDDPLLLIGLELEHAGGTNQFTFCLMQVGSQSAHWNGVIQSIEENASEAVRVILSTWNGSAASDSSRPMGQRSADQVQPRAAPSVGSDLAHGHYVVTMEIYAFRDGPVQAARTIHELRQTTGSPFVIFDVLDTSGTHWRSDGTWCERGTALSGRECEPGEFRLLQQATVMAGTPREAAQIARQLPGENHRSYQPVYVVIDSSGQIRVVDSAQLTSHQGLG